MLTLVLKNLLRGQLSKLARQLSMFDIHVSGRVGGLHIIVQGAQFVLETSHIGLLSNT